MLIAEYAHFYLAPVNRALDHSFAVVAGSVVDRIALLTLVGGL